MSTAAVAGREEPDLSVVVTQLMKGVLYRDAHESQWRQLLQLQPQVRDYVAVIGLTVVVDESEGYAFLRSLPALDQDDGRTAPRLIPRRSLSFHVSLLLALLRKKLIEFDATASDTKLVLSREQLVELVRVFMPEGSNEARMIDQIDAHITKVRRRAAWRRAGGELMSARVDGIEATEFAPTRTGFRLARLEVYNWGTFHRRAWRLDLAGDNGLLTGDIGSGKSTLVDAITTLLLPANRISYNKAAGAEVRERSLRSYVDGHYKSERSETTGSSRPVGLRGADSFSVLLGVFRNDGYDQDVSLAQVFWTREGVPGQPDRFFAVADRPLSVADDFADFGSSTAALRKRLRAAGVRVYDHFPEYGRDFRRRLGIESEQAMELFHQTVSMKSVGNLNDFVRSHMLEPFDAREWVAKLVAHFDDLTRAHDAVVKARSQLDELSPLLAECDTYDALGEEIAALEAERTALPYFFARHRAGLLTDRIAARERDVVAGKREQQDREAAVAALNDRRQALLLERAGHGGDRIGELERQIGEAEQLRDQRRKRADRFNELLRLADLPAVERAEQFDTRLAEVTAAAEQVEQAEAALRERADQIAINRNEVQRESDELNAELVSLRSRRSSIPANSLALRRRLCEGRGCRSRSCRLPAS